MEKKVKDVQNVENSLKKIEALRRDLLGNLSGLSFDYINKISGKLKNEILDDLTNSITHRYYGIHYHLELLINEHDASNYFLNKNPRHISQFHSAHSVLQRSTMNQFSLFDSLIFQTLSLFDYNSSLIEYICGGKKEPKKKWTSICKASRDKKNNSFSQLKIASLILKINEEWLDKLYFYRSQLIHYKSERGGNLLRQNLKSGESVIRVYAPQQFVDHFSRLNQLNSKYEITLRFVSFWLVSKAFSDTIKIISEIREFMNNHRVVPKSEQPYTFNRKGDNSHRSKRK